ncbi:hypothetical protein NCER_101639 [Vairimorpha ceranae BRL01]|uniref:Rho-GAP domain-containing protein n=2 Tax=Vairimorpha ceranae TaxID=40302 RepID=C4VAG8_VAIC1|nr:lrg1-like protein [Vairimorpha ceranae]EEQ81786.1 hypothetical protein NCER_101639 [Vairimorpha ceranae BRL01]KKO75770.1 lrg1-like protein [Vairimorpha ceranae]
MEEILKNKMNTEKMETVNDLDDREFIEYKKNFCSVHSFIIEKYCNYWEICRLNQTFLGRIFFPIDKILRNDSRLWISSNLKYGNKHVLVPIDFYTLTETILSLDVRIGGLFRVRNSMITVKECVDMLEREIYNRSSFKDIRDKLAESFNVIDLTTAFKEILRNYKHSVIPEGFLPIIIKLFSVDKQEDRLILYHYLYISLPKFNRHILEATIFFLYLIHDIATVDGSDYTNNMDMAGISTVIMPNLLLKNVQDFSLAEVSLLVEFMKEFILNFKTIAQKNTLFEIID